MKATFMFWVTIVFCVSAVLPVKAQIGKTSEAGYQRQKADDERKIRDNTETSLNALNRLGSSSERVSDRFSKKASKSKITKSKLRVNQEDFLKYESFLKDSDTGIFKLLPLIDCAPLNVVVKAGDNKTDYREAKARRDECQLENENIRYNANAYSFREKKHILSDSSDLVLDRDFLVTPQAAVQTILVNLGNIQLNKITSDSAGMEFLFNFKPEKTIDEAIKQSQQIRDGIVIGNYKYSNLLPAEENSAIALRSIAYSNSTVSSGDSSDVIVVFRIVRREEDGAVTILWKELNRQKGIELETK